MFPYRRHAGCVRRAEIGALVVESIQILGCAFSPLEAIPSQLTNTLDLSGCPSVIVGPVNKGF